MKPLFFPLIILVCLANCQVQAQAQIRELTIEDADAGPGKFGRLRLHCSDDHYYLLYRSENLSTYYPGGAVLGHGGMVDIHDQYVGGLRTFYYVDEVPKYAPRDLDRDGIDDVFELRNSSFLNPLDGRDSFLDFDRDGISNLDEYRAGSDLTQARLTTVLETSPGNGVDDVAVTRETVIRLTGALAEGTVVTSDELFAAFGGERLTGRVQVSTDRRTVTMPNLPDPITGERIQPDEKTALWSISHDTGRFEIVGSTTISADGLYAVPDTGVGIVAPGWLAVAPGVRKVISPINNSKS